MEEARNSAPLTRTHVEARFRKDPGLFVFSAVLTAIGRAGSTRRSPVTRAPQGHAERIALRAAL